MKNMFKSLVAIASLVVALSITAADNASVGVTAGYNNNYVVNGVVRNNASALIAVDASKTLKYADVYLKGTLLPNNDLDQSHWTLGTGKAFDLFSDFSLRADADITRHQSGVTGIPNSTEFGAKLALKNPYVTPYVRGSYDYNLDQTGVSAGLYRVQALPFGFSVTPLAEYGKFTDYDAFVGKVTVARPFELSFGTLTPFADVSYVDNNFSTSKFNFATKELNGSVVVSAGLNFRF
jgi:hypothetical protein